MKECPACGACFPDTLNNCGTDGKELRHSLRGELVLDGRYKLERRLGHGGMGIVYKASHVFLKSTHAVKVILPDLVGNDPMLGTRFRQEAMVAASIVHKNIVRVTDFGMANREMPYLVMEFLQGKSLHDLLHQRRRLSVKLALEIMEAMTAGVAAAHRQTIVHRDLKPLNIFLQQGLPISEGLKVLDFGLAKIKSEELLGSFVQARTTSLMGSPHYMAPEQWGDGEPDARADIYGLAIILYQMLAGKPPFHAQSMPEIMRKHLMDPPPPFSLQGVQLSPALETTVFRALEKNPEDRPASAEAFMRELREAIGTEAESSVIAYEMLLPPGVSRESAETISEQIAQDSIAREDLSLLETQLKAEGEAERLLRELEEAQSRAEEARKRVEEAASKRAEQESARKRAEAEAARKLAEEEAARKRTEEELRLRAEEESQRKLAEEEATRQLAEAEARKREKEEQERRRALEEANRLAREVESALRLAEEARQRAEAEAQHRAREEAARKAAEKKAEQLARELEEAQNRAEEARKRVEEVASKRAEQEEAQRRAEAEAERNRAEEEQARKLTMAEAQRKAQEEIARKLSEAEAARERAEEEARKLEIEEANRLKAQQEANRLAREVEAAQRGVEEARGRAQKEAEQRAKEETARKAAEEKAERLVREVKEARKRIEEQALKHAQEDAERERAEQEAKQQRSEAEAQRLAAEASARKLAEEEADRFAREVEEAQRRAEQAGQRADDLARMRAEDEAARRRAEEEALRLAREVEDARRRIEELRARAEQEALAAAAQARSPASSHRSLRNTLASPGSTSPEVLHVPSPRRISPQLLSLGAMVLVALAVGGYLTYRVRRSNSEPPVVANQDSQPPVVANQNSQPPVVANRGTDASNKNAKSDTRSELVLIPGGAFMMGRNDAPKTDVGDAQQPAKRVTVEPFLMDRTEVTNAEYAEFVQQSQYPPPKAWSGNKPPGGQGQWPVTNVSLDDAEKFAVWRSTRDHIQYRLPTEKEWEYAARGGSGSRLYPWGNDWCDACANLGTGKGKKDLPQPVGSHPQGANPMGVLDLIGNVWEWTSSEASYYQGTPVADKYRGEFVIRGGSHQSLIPDEIKARGSKEVPATLRVFVKRSTKDRTLGFRLVRDAS